MPEIISHVPEVYLRIWLIRHGATLGNKAGRYIGITDEGLSEEGKTALLQADYPYPSRLYASPMKRCLETAGILFPGKPVQVIPDLRECDFGEFENKNYQDLKDDPHYRQWVDSFCEGPVPGGEQKCMFQKRTLRGFYKVVSDCVLHQATDAAIVAHGGTIMAVMDALAGDEKKSYYDWIIKNGCGYQITVCLTEWEKKNILTFSEILCKMI